MKFMIAYIVKVCLHGSYRRFLRNQYIPNCIIGLLTKMREAIKPFHNAKIPSLFTSFFPATKIESPFSACLVLRTQKGFVAIAETHPAELEHLVMLANELGSKLKNFLACAYATKYMAYDIPLPKISELSPEYSPLTPSRQIILLIAYFVDLTQLCKCISSFTRSAGQTTQVVIVEATIDDPNYIIFQYNSRLNIQIKLIQELKTADMIRDPAEIQNSNVWEQAAKLKGKDAKSATAQKTLIVVGPASSGKTSFIKAFKSDLDFETKPTNLIQYSYIKKTGVKKQTVHCYEIATKALTDIISSLLSKDNFTQIVLILCLDLSHPNKLVDEALQWFNILRNQVQKFVQEKLFNKQDKFLEFKQQLKEQYAENEDKSSIQPMPLQTIVIGTKYDLFQKYDTESRKWLARALRYIAHHNNASLYFCSTKNMQVGAQLRAYFQQKFQADKKNKTASQFEHTKPIFINNGQDSIKSMNLPSSSSLNTIDILKKQLSSLFGQQEEKKKQMIDFSKYGESRIDTVIAEKKKEIERITKMLQNAENRSTKRI